MGYGQGMGKIDTSFECSKCSFEVTVRIPVGKDYIYEETIKEALNRLIEHCDWKCQTTIYGEPYDLICSSCSYCCGDFPDCSCSS